MQGRIAKLAAGYGVDFVGAHQDDVRGLDKLLMSRVYPEHPDFHVWDAVDDAFAQMEEASATDIRISYTFFMPCTRYYFGELLELGAGFAGHSRR